MERMRNVQEMMQHIRRMPLFQQVIPQEAGIGWPIPIRKAENVYVTFPFFGQVYHKELHQTAIFPPFATLTINWQNQLPVEYVDLRFHNPWPGGPWTEQVGVFPHEAVAHLQISEYQQKRLELLAMYDDMLTILIKGGVFTPEWKKDFQNRLLILMEPGLEPFYRALAPKFFGHFLPM